jgi:hypothetical protein
MRFDHAPVKGFLRGVRQLFPLATNAQARLRRNQPLVVHKPFLANDRSGDKL